ncbi:MAG: hypothetical protein NC210_07970, partial [[Clostridium] fimetarium]|nr:hypothetical protein [[Clostridium] fimetarium]
MQPIQIPLLDTTLKSSYFSPLSYEKSSLEGCFFCGKTGILASQAPRDDEPWGFSSTLSYEKSSLAGCFFCGKTGILASQALRDDEPWGFSSPLSYEKSSLAGCFFCGKTGIRTLGTRKGTT